MAKSFVERPKMPILSDISKDIEEAPSDDVVFTKFNPAEILNGNSTVDLEEDEEEKSDSNSINLHQLNENITEAYQKAVQMVKLCEILREAPSNLEQEYKELECLGEEVSIAIEDLKRSSQSLPSSTSGKPSQGKKKKGKKIAVDTLPN